MHISGQRARAADVRERTSDGTLAGKVSDVVSLGGGGLSGELVLGRRGLQLL